MYQTKGGFKGGGDRGSVPPFPKCPPFFEEIIPMQLYFITRLSKCVVNILHNIALQNTDF